MPRQSNDEGHLILPAWSDLTWGRAIYWISLQNTPKTAEEDRQAISGARVYLSRDVGATGEAAMNTLRLAPAARVQHSDSCCRCAQAGERWDRIAAKSYCPQCQEQLAAGEMEPLIEPTEARQCAVCGHRGTVCFQTFPLEAELPIEMDLCPRHLRDVLSRRLGPFGYHQLFRQLQAVGFHASEVFLLHDAFYDRQGRALKPVSEW